MSNGKGAGGIGRTLLIEVPQLLPKLISALGFDAPAVIAYSGRRGRLLIHNYAPLNSKRERGGLSGRRMLTDENSLIANS